MSLSQSNEVAAPVAHDVKDSHVHGVHAVPKRILLGVYFALLFFTVVTVTVAKLDLGQYNILVALIVAVIKGSLVALFFMHLFWDSPFNSVILIAALFFVALFIGLAMLDAHSYEINLEAPQSVQGSQ